MILPISVVLPFWPTHRDRSSAPGTTKRSVVLSYPVLEVPIMLRRRFVLQSPTRSCIGVGTTSERVCGRCVGWAQGLSLGTKVVQTCGLVIAMPLLRQLDTRSTRKNDVYDSLRDTVLCSLSAWCLVTLSMEVDPHRVMLQ